MNTFTWKNYDTDKEVKHKYGSCYDKHFGSIRDNINDNILEVGCKPGSAHLWTDYFPNAMVIGADIRKVVFDHPRFEYFEFDQRSRKSYRELIKSYDNIKVVIDDGPHRAFPQITSLQHLLPALPNDSWYVIEDLFTTDPSHSTYRKRMRGSDVSVNDIIKEWKAGIFNVHRCLPQPNLIQEIDMEIFVEQGRLSEIVFIHKK